MIRECGDGDFEAILRIINDAAEVYRGVIPADRWKVPYMSSDELRHEMSAGVDFSGYDRGQGLVGVMGTQPVKDVRLIRHAYVSPAFQGQGIGGALLAALRADSKRPVLIGTWAAARWAIRFYEGHGFGLIEGAEKDRLLKTYWSIPDRQVETSVVLADPLWFERNPKPAGEDDLLAP